MASGLPYDSDEGRNLRRGDHGGHVRQAYLTSAEIARAMGPFPRYRMNRKPFLEVIGMHRAAAEAIPRDGVPEDLMEAARECWRQALERGRKWGFKNARSRCWRPPAPSPS